MEGYILPSSTLNVVWSILFFSIIELFKFKTWTRPVSLVRIPELLDFKHPSNENTERQLYGRIQFIPQPMTSS